MKRRGKNIVFFIISCVMVFNVVQAQETNFSQFYNTPMQTNPGMISTSNQFKAVFNYRKQSVSGSNTFSTSNVALSMPYKYTKTDGEGNKEQKRLLAFGISMLNDAVGDNGLLKTNGIEGAIALNMPLRIFSSGSNIEYDSYLSIGVQGGFFQRGIDVNAVTTGNQFSGGIFNGSLPTGEVFSRENLNYSSYSAGVFWYSQDIDEITRRYIGFSVHNINQPNISFLEDEQASLPMRLTVNAGFDVVGSPYTSFSLQPNIRWVQIGNFSQITAGFLGRYNLPNVGSMGGGEEGLNLSMGVWYSSSNGMIAMAGAENSRFIANISYDMGLMNPQEITSSTAFEITVGIKLGKTTRDIVKKLPQDNIDPFASVENAEETDSLERAEAIDPEVNPADISTKDLSIFDEKVMFLYSETKLSPDTKVFLDEMAAMMIAYPAIKIAIEGHACSLMESEEENNRLSLERAKSVKNYLISKGVNVSNLQTAGFGAKEPIASNDTEMGQVQNRRVEFRVVSE